MTENLSYDYYMVREYKSTSRWNIHKNDKNAGDWNVYTTHTGICRDFVNIYAIMCRELGIPCTTIENKVHGWSLIWLDGKWVDVDLTTDIKRAVYKEDVTDVSNADDTICYDAFMRDWLVKSIKNVTVGVDIYTEKYVTTGKH